MANHFRVAARTLTHLGAELITSDAIALNELLKNAFDAGSPRVKIVFEVPIDPVLANRLTERLRTKQTTSDMVRHQLLQNAQARRAPTIVQEAIQKLPPKAADCASSIEALINEYCHILVEDSGEGMRRTDLVEAFLTVGTPTKLLKKKAGESSRRPILGDKGIGRLSMMRLGMSARVTSSRGGETHWYYIDFDWSPFYDPNTYIEDVPIEVKTGKRKNDRDESGTQIRITGLTSGWSESDVTQFVNAYLRRLRDPFTESAPRFPVDVILNNRRMPIPPLPEWLIDNAHLQGEWTFLPKGNKQLEPNDVAVMATLTWRKNTPERREWTVKDVIARAKMTTEDLLRIGRCRASVYWFNRALLAKKVLGDFSVKDVRDELDVWCGGFSIYRDGFRVGWTGAEADDWLGLDSRALRRGGFVVNRIQTVGSVAISQKDNPHLVDAANREGLLACPEFEGLKRLLEEIVLTELREVVAKEQELEHKTLVADTSAAESIDRAETDFQKTRKLVSSLADAVPPAVRAKVKQIEENLHQHVDYVKKVQEALMLAREQKTEVLELAGLGMSIDIVAHELVRATENTEQLVRRLQQTKDPKAVDETIDALRAQLKAIDKRLRAIDPLSPSGRHRKETFDLVRLVRGILEGYVPRFQRHDVNVRLTVDGKEKDFEMRVTMVKGLLAHVFENVVSNSIYWLKQATVPGVEGREFHVEIDRKARTIEFTDTGPGIDPSYRDRVFSPYFSRKPDGRGLGLFIARELAEYHGAHLVLDNARDADGRLRTFVLELPRE